MGPIISVFFASIAALLLWFAAKLFVMRRRMKGLVSPENPVFLQLNHFHHLAKPRCSTSSF